MVTDTKPCATGVLHHAIDQLDIKAAIFQFPGIVPAAGKSTICLIGAVDSPATDKPNMVTATAKAIATGIVGIIVPLGDETISRFAM